MTMPAGRLVPVNEYEQLVAVADAARTLVAIEATRHDESIPNAEWILTYHEAVEDLIAAVNATQGSSND